MLPRDGQHFNMKCKRCGKIQEHCIVTMNEKTRNASVRCTVCAHGVFEILNRPEARKYLEWKKEEKRKGYLPGGF